MRFMNSRSCEVIKSPPSSPLRNSSSQIRLSRSRWLLGSSSNMPSGRISRMRGSAPRIFPPPESRPPARPVHAFLAEAQARGHLSRAGIQRIAVQLLEAPLHLAIALDQCVHLVG